MMSRRSSRRPRTAASSIDVFRRHLTSSTRSWTWPRPRPSCQATWPTWERPPTICRSRINHWRVFWRVSGARTWSRPSKSPGRSREGRKSRMRSRSLSSLSGATFSRCSCKSARSERQTWSGCTRLWSVRSITRAPRRCPRLRQGSEGRSKRSSGLRRRSKSLRSGRRCRSRTS